MTTYDPTDVDDLIDDAWLAAEAMTQGEIDAELERLRAWQTEAGAELQRCAAELQRLGTENEMLRNDAQIVLESSNALHAKLEAVLAWARLAYLAVKFAETINPRGLQSLVSSAPDSVKE